MQNLITKIGLKGPNNKLSQSKVELGGSGLGESKLGKTELGEEHTLFKYIYQNVVLLCLNLYMME